MLVGACAFKSLPTAGEIEIAHFTFPGHEGCGIATRMARYLLGLAADRGVHRVRAQTIAREYASTRILEKLGFEHVGSLDHPEDDLVWAWSLQLGRALP